MNGFDQPTETSRPPWKIIALIAGAAALAVVIVVAAVLFVRGRATVMGETQLLARVETQLDQSLAGCAQEADPAACREKKVLAAAEATGADSLCARLEGDAGDECIWKVAREREDETICAQILDAENATLCSDGILLARAVASLDSELCAGIQDAEKKTGCQLTIAGPVTSENCVERNDESYCAQFGAYLAAKEAKDPDLCEQIGDPRLLETCRNAVSPGDRDLDGLDASEESAYGSSDTATDSDGDGLSDFSEITEYESDPANADSDGDGFSDGSEVENGYNPNGPGTL